MNILIFMYEQKMHPLYGEDERRGEILGNIRMVSSGFQNYYTCSPYAGGMSSMSPSNLSMHTKSQPQQQHQHNQGFNPIVDQRVKEKSRPGKFASGVGLEFDGMTVLCRVCGDKASGFHYGVHSCEGCKGFFRRSIQQKIQYRPCMKNQQCSILRINRNRCQYCRLKKCIAVGMSRDAVRFGRVPKREKAKILAEMQRANQQSQLNALQAELDDEHKLINTIVQAHIETYEYTRQKMAALCENAQRNPSYVQCPTQMACPLNPNPSGKGFKADSEMLEDFSERFTPAIRGVVEFAKRIPGFGILCQDDQVTLLKAGVFEVLLVRLACMFDSQTNTMMFVNGQMYKRELGQVKGNAGFLINSMFDFADRINSLQLTDAEVGLFCAVVLIAPDRPGIRNKDCVEKLQEKIIQGLHATIRSNHSEGPSLYTRLIMKLPDLKTLNSLHSEKLLAFKMEPSTPGVSSTTGEMEKPEPVIPTGQKLFNALTGMVRPPVNHPVPPYHLQSSFQLGLPPQNRYLYPPISARAIQRPWEQIPKPFLSKEGSLSPQSMDMDSSEGSQVSPMSLDSLKKFEIHHVKREGDVLSDTSDGHSSLEHSPKNSENDVLDSSDRTGVETGSTISNGAEYKQTDSDHSDRESPKSTHSVHSDSVLYKPHKKFRAHRLSDVGSPVSQLNKKLEMDDGDIPDGLILRTPMDNVHNQYRRQEPPTSRYFPGTKESHPARIAVPVCPFPSNLSMWSDSHMSSQGVSNHNYINQALLSGSQYPVRNMYPPVAQYPITVPNALPAPKPIMSDIKCEPLNLSTKSSLGITQQGIPIKVEQTAN